MITKIYSHSNLIFKQECLLFCLEREILINDIIYSDLVLHHDKEYINNKTSWFSRWEHKANSLLNRKLEDKKKVFIQDFNKLNIYKELENERLDIDWKKQILKLCIDFTPYDWHSLLELGNDSEEMKDYFSRYSNSQLDPDMRNVSLKLIEILLSDTNIYYSYDIL